MKLLVSVRDAQEARDAALGGADWIDLKQPQVGPLGAVTPATARAVVNALQGQCPISAACGELRDWQSPSELLTVAGIEVVKLGLADCGSITDWQSHWLAAFANCVAHGKRLAAVVYADWQLANAPHPAEVLECAFRACSQYLLIDTFDKQGLSSIERFGPEPTARLLHLARQRGITTVLAGSLRVNDLPLVATLPVDVVAIRGAACVGQRDSHLALTKVRHFRRRLVEVSASAKDLNSCLTTRD